METVRVETWHQLKQLMPLVEQYYNQTDIYDCTFPVLAAEVARMFADTVHYAIYMVPDVGYIIFYLPMNLIYDTLWVDTAFIVKDKQSQHIFKEVFMPLIYNMGRMTKTKWVKFQAKIPADVWSHITEREVQVEKIMVIENDLRGEDYVQG